MMIVGDRGIVCVDWDERSLRVLDAVFGRGSLKVRKAVHVPLPQGMNSRDPAELGTFLRRTLAEHRIRTRRAIVDVPRQDAVFTLMPLPQGTVTEIAAMVHVQAAKELPFAKEQAVVDFAITGEQKQGMCEVWVAAVRTAVVDRYRQVVTSAGLKLERIGLRPYANMAALNREQAPGGRTLMVDIGPSMTEIDVIADGRLVYTRAASVSIPEEGWSTRPAEAAAAEPADGEDTIPLLDETGPLPSPMEALLIEVSRTIEAYRATAPGMAINQIVLAGSVPLDAKVVERFEARFGAPARIYEVPAEVGWRRAADASTAAFSAAVGLALSSVGEGIAYFDFLHPKEPETVERERKRQRPVLVAAIALFVLVAGVFAYQPIRQRKVEIQDLKSKIRDANRDSKARKELLDQLADVQAWQAKNVIWIDKLKRLSEVFPENKKGYITRLVCNEKGTVNVELVTKDFMVATAIVHKLAEIKDSKGKPLYGAKPDKMVDSQLDDYPLKDGVSIVLEELQKGP